MTYSGLAVGLADELYAALRNSTTQYNLCFTASVSVREASHLLNHQTFHLLIADLEYLRDKRQTERLSGIRRISFIPVIILSDAPERDLGGMIQLGADICISGRCPCSAIANLTYAQLRRYTEYNHYNDPGGAGVSSFQVGDIFIDPARRQVEVHGHLVSLRPREFSLLLYFMRNPRIVLTAEQICEHAWEMEGSYNRGVSGPVALLRKAIEPDISNPRYIETIPRIGYRFTAYHGETCDDCSSFVGLL